jgi:hypothetical protein
LFCSYFTGNTYGPTRPLIGLALALHFSRHKPNVTSAVESPITLHYSLVSVGAVVVHFIVVLDNWDRLQVAVMSSPLRSD